jgi:hypothetical protein
VLAVVIATVDKLAQLPWKAATATLFGLVDTTVRRAADQAEQVFARKLTVFPPPLLDIGDTFFSTTVDPSPSTPGITL